MRWVHLFRGSRFVVSVATCVDECLSVVWASKLSSNWRVGECAKAKLVLLQVTEYRHIRRHKQTAIAANKVPKPPAAPPGLVAKPRGICRRSRQILVNTIRRRLLNLLASHLSPHLRPESWLLGFEAKSQVFSSTDSNWIETCYCICLYRYISSTQQQQQQQYLDKNIWRNIIRDYSGINDRYLIYLLGKLQN